jgi:multiple sugar transport system permease protein
LTQKEPLNFVGLDNFRSLLFGEHSREFWKYLLNTIYLLMGAPISIAGSLFLAILLHKPFTLSRNKRIDHLVGLSAFLIGVMGAVTLASLGKSDSAFAALLLTAAAALGLLLGPIFFRTMFYLPQVTAGVAMYILWKSLFNPETGYINRIISSLFSFSPNWLTSVSNLWAMDPEKIIPSGIFFGLGARDALIIMGTWMSMGGGNMLLYLAALSAIPKERYEIAHIDGAGRWSTFWNVTWPELMPITFLITIITVIGGIQGGFEQARVMTSGGPVGTTTTLGYYIYNIGFEEFKFGLASAICWIMFSIIFLITLLNWKYNDKYKYFG